ncbi:MAG: phosphate ABC transporter permease PstA [Verrucomicrobia bacterium]|nr:phosphate ABC transporter permease PstA [Verrucomicrobiota bacterium]
MSFQSLENSAPARRKRAKVSLFAQGEPMIWLTGGGLAIALSMIIGLLALIFYHGINTLWPVAVLQFQTLDGSLYMGEITRAESFRSNDAEVRVLQRRLVRTGNFEFSGEHFIWINDHDVQAMTQPEWAVVIERTAWGRFYGFPESFTLAGETVAITPEAAWEKFGQYHGAVSERREKIRELETKEVGRVNRRLEKSRLALRAVEMSKGLNRPAWQSEHEKFLETEKSVTKEFKTLQEKIGLLRAENSRYVLNLKTAQGKAVAMPLEAIVRAYPANQLSTLGKAGIYFSRWQEFLFNDPREANSEGGVFPAIFGTVIMTLLMSLAVVPFGVMAALYLREYAQPGVIVSAVRISINNLAGVPSIVFGVFGLGFFCYLIGASIDELFFASSLPNPTFGKGGILWASLTLALLTLPVVIVSTEEALAAVPNSMREGSYACGGSKWQTIKRIVLPRAMPGIMTGMILAMARGAGEVAPLMLVGAVKLAPELPVDSVEPFVHAERSFMHLGFHIYDLGFQSQNSEAAKPMVFTTTLLLIVLIFLLNLLAVRLRTRLRRKFVSTAF